MTSITEARQALAQTTFDGTLRQIQAELFYKEQAGIVADRAFADLETAIGNLNAVNADLIAKNEEKDKEIADLRAKLAERGADRTADLVAADILAASSTPEKVTSIESRIATPVNGKAKP